MSEFISNYTNMYNYNVKGKRKKILNKYIPNYITEYDYEEYEELSKFIKIKRKFCSRNYTDITNYL